MKSLMFAAVVALIGWLAPGIVSASDEGSIVRGGRLYDHWSREVHDRPPAGLHPALAARRGSMSAAESWRCKECHGWDYKGNHGMVGIRGKQGADATAIVAILKDSTHRYGSLLHDRDLLDLANFVSRGQMETQTVIESARRSTAAATKFEKYFGTICSGCHGLDGNRLREIAPLGDAARQRPHEILHVIVNGHPGGNMPGLSALGADVAGGILVHLQTLPTVNLAASIAHGGRLYDDWQTEAGAQRQLLPHPAYPRAAFLAADAALTWRCKSCHGWDYVGSQGNYASGRNATGIKGIRGMAGADPVRIAAVLRDNTHLYAAVLKERDLLDLANFVSAGQVNMDTAIDRATRRARGDARRAAAYYGTICASCHGIDGNRIITAPSLGTVARANPWESLHKIANGHPNEKMPALRELDPQVQADILAFLQGLPEIR